MARSLSFWIDGTPPSPNELRRKGYHERSDIANVWKHAAYYTGLQAAAEHGTELPFTRCKVALNFHFKTKRRRDLDNLIASAKPILDGMVPAIISDDHSDIVRLLLATVSPSTAENGIWVIIDEVE